MSSTVRTDSSQSHSVHLLKAVNFAVRHKYQDLEKTPCMNRPFGVVNMLMNIGKVTDTKVLVAAVLHDTVEETETTFEEIEANFGKRIRDIVDEVTDDKKLTKEEIKQKQIDYAPKLSTKAKLIKLAYKLYNLRDLLKTTPEGWTEERVQEYFNWASQLKDFWEQTKIWKKNYLTHWLLKTYLFVKKCVCKSYLRLVI